ncbi:MAG TPA: MFS transporter [Gaiellaceae bacterium]|jgi:EmrB/QacA subfamily drug resistance transporter|nr:MFS transporter [Gaiellaceae bacterium]
MERKWWTLVAVCVAIFMLLLDITIVNVALPSIQSSLGASFSDLQWVVDAYALTLATCVLTAGSTSDLFGRKRVFVAGIVIFTAASALCGVANDPLFLILSRAVQGIGGAIMFATSLALLSQEFHGRERGTAFGIWGATTGAAVAIGPLIGGMLTSWLSWRWIFLVNVPIGIVAVIVSVRKLRESSDPEHGSIDPLGLVLLTGGLFCLVFALIEGNKRGWSSAFIIGLFVGSAVLLTAFVFQQLRRTKPMIDLRLFRKPAFTGVQIAAFALSSSLFAMFLYLTLYMQEVLGYSPLQAGLRFLPITLLAFVAAPIGGKLTASVPIRLLMGGGLVLVALSMALMAGLTPSSGWTALLAGFIVGGIGIGFTNPALATTAISTVPREQAGAGSGANATFRQVGIATGIAALGAIFQHQLTGYASSHPQSPGSSAGHTNGTAQYADHAAFVSALNDILWVGFGVAAVGAVCAFVLIRKRDFVASGPQPAVE